ncbi:putative Type II secretion system protein B [Candidatus Desulfarcum epimagneticum]|uniref:Putative Type II secretion system protein B n=1 Tax=uncultured Desulfobacteraceae bacterium TaxID=218296 RepID=A0A484HDT5_9BACT|nr:putative Type II secretion system protein B [uncultured Desulfobacteraceae bacterium]
MSSILKALKKVQNESPGHYEFRPWPRRDPAPETFWAKLKARLRPVFWVPAVLICLALGAGAVWLSRDPAPATPVSDAPAPLAPVGASPPGIAEAPRAAAEKSPEPRISSPRPGAFETQPAPRNPARRDPAQRIPMLNDPDITLQAIVWAGDPRDRVAVINGRFLGEGDMAGAFQVTGILRTEALLKGPDGRAFRLAYKSR